MLAAIGGIELKHWSRAPEFLWRASRAMDQARNDPTCHHAHVIQHRGIYFSLTVWDGPADMKRFAASGAHGKLMKVSPRLGIPTYFHHFQCTQVPSVTEAYASWKNAGLIKAA